MSPSAGQRAGRSRDQGAPHRGARVPAAGNSRRCRAAARRGDRNLRQRLGHVSERAAGAAHPRARDDRHRRAARRCRAARAGASRRATASRSRNICRAAIANIAAPASTAPASRPTRAVHGGIRYGSTPLDRGAGAVGRLQPVSLHASAHGRASRAGGCRRPISRRWRCRSATASNGPGSTAAPAPARPWWCKGRGSRGSAASSLRRRAAPTRSSSTGLARDERRLAVARELGAHHTVMVDKQNLLEEVKRLTGGRMADIVIDASGGGPEIVNASVALLRKRGVLVIAARKGADRRLRPAPDRRQAGDPARHARAQLRGGRACAWA